MKFFDYAHKHKKSPSKKSEIAAIEINKTGSNTENFYSFACNLNI
jgi:hypothetical protein